MKKYWEIGKINFLNNIFYFSDFFFRALFILLILFIFLGIWKTIYSDTTKVIEGFTIVMMIWYLLLTESIVSSTTSLVREVNKEIQSGDIAYQLNKPYSYIFYHLAKTLSYRIISFSVIFILGAILVYFMVGPLSFNWVNLPWIIIVCLMALILDFFIVMPLALLAFWFEDTIAFRWIYEKFLFTIGGMLLPLEMFPKWLAQISLVLPFSFIVYYPAKLFVDFNLNNFIQVILSQAGYILLFSLITYLVYHIGVRRLNINGG